MTRDKLVEGIIAAVWAWMTPKHTADDITRLYVRSEFLPLIDRYLAEQAALVLPLVRKVLDQHRAFPSEGRSTSFDGPYEYTVRIRLLSNELEDAEQWLARQAEMPVERMAGTEKPSAEVEVKPPRRILRNRARCRKCGDVIESTHRHDWVACKCKAIFTDGGLDYIRRGAENLEDIEDLTEYTSVLET